MYPRRYTIHHFGLRHFALFIRWYTAEAKGAIYNALKKSIHTGPCGLRFFFLIAMFSRARTLLYVPLPM
jgi:hypothetical protein